MTESTPLQIDFSDRARGYRELAATLSGLLSGETDLIANAANTSALLASQLADLNWVGFYLLRGDELVLGPFQGRPACVRIAMGRGVCGAAAQARRTLLVPNVHEYPDHIVCDSASNSEIVLPLLDGARLIGVLDLDSPKFSRFDQIDQAGLEAIAAIFVASLRAGS